MSSDEEFFPPTLLCPACEFAVMPRREFYPEKRQAVYVCPDCQYHLTSGLWPDTVKAGNNPTSTGELEIATTED